MKPRILILCTHNSGRSQIAEGFVRKIGGERVVVESAGTEATRVHPLAIRAMDEIGIDIRSHTSKTLDRFLDQPWDHVVTVCDNANESCPVFPRAANRVHWSFEDPSAAKGSDDEKLAVFRRVRDEITKTLEPWLAERIRA